MSRRQKYPLRVLTEEEQEELVGISRASSESASRVARAKALLAVSPSEAESQALIRLSPHKFADYRQGFKALSLIQSVF